MIIYNVNNFLKIPVTGDTQLFIREPAGTIIKVIYGGSVANVFSNLTNLIIRFTASTLPFVLNFESEADASLALTKFQTYYSRITYHPLPTGITGNNIPLADYIDKGGVPTLPSVFPEGYILKGNNKWTIDPLTSMPTGSILIGDTFNTGQPQFITGDAYISLTGLLQIPDSIIYNKSIGEVLTGITSQVQDNDSINLAISKLQDQIDFYTNALVGTGVFTQDISVVLSNNKTLGKYLNGQTIPSTGKNIFQVLTDIATEYLLPTFSSFIIVGQSTQVEVGSLLTAGTYTFTWSTTNSSNITPFSLSITDINTSTVLVTGIANVGSTIYTFPSDIDFNSVGTYVFQIAGTNTNSGNFSRNFNINTNYKVFYGPSATAPSNSSEVRALPSNRFTNAGNTFTLNTGNSLDIFTFAVPSTFNLVSVIDLDSLNADITSQYILTSFNVDDSVASPVSYKIYTMTQAIPYTNNHRHQISYS